MAIANELDCARMGSTALRRSMAAAAAAALLQRQHCGSGSGSSSSESIERGYDPLAKHKRQPEVLGQHSWTMGTQ